MADQQGWLSAWYQGRWWLYLLLPVTWLLMLVASCRRFYLSRHCVPVSKPVIVVGNIALGGTGKTPLLIAMVKYLKAKGYSPGVVSRGYGGQAPYYPYEVTPLSDPAFSGDEPLLIALEAHCPVIVGSQRVKSAEQLIEKFQCDVILSDDGLQHYALPRQFEVCVVDGSRQMGNGLCLPSGPLREPPSRLNEVDCVVVNGSQGLSYPTETPSFGMSLQPELWGHVAGQYPDSEVPSIPWVSSEGLKAVTGIGNPDRFFTTLKNLGLETEGKSFPDHHPFSQSDLAYAEGQVLLMTAKDAVKCRAFADEQWWYLSVAAQLDTAFWQQLDGFMEKVNE